jgi:transposase
MIESSRRFCDGGFAMLGQQVRADQLFYDFRLEDHVPAAHLLRGVEARLDLSFVRRTLASHYSHTGRPSVDPELMVRMLLIGYLYGIRSERRLVEEVHLNLAYRWFCRLGLNGEVPDRSTFSKNRHGRFRESDVFRKLFEEVVRQCMAAGLVGGAGAAVDRSFIEADANYDRRVPGGSRPESWNVQETVTRPVREYLEALDASEPRASDEPKPTTPKYISETDPEAAWSIKDGIGHFGYLTNYLIDTDHGVILDVEATPARTSREIVAAKVMLERTKEHLGIMPDHLAADGSYGTARFITWLFDRSVTPHIPLLDRKHQTQGMFTRDAFDFDPTTDTFRCPGGKTLTYRGMDRAARLRRYFARQRDCAGCPVKRNCTAGEYRTLTLPLDEVHREQVRALYGTEECASSEHLRQMRA